MDFQNYELDSSIREFTQTEERKLKRKHNPMMANFMTVMDFGEPDRQNEARSGPSSSGLGKTMRGLIMDKNRELDSIDYPRRAVPAEVEESHQLQPSFRVIESQESEETDTPCIVRCILVGITVLVIIGAIVALVVLAGGRGDGGKKFGSILYQSNYQVCQNTTVTTNDSIKTIEIKCEFNDTHLYWETLKETKMAVVTSPDQRTFDLGNASLDNNIWTWNVTNMTCPLAGLWTIRFMDSDKQDIVDGDNNPYVSSFYVTAQEVLVRQNSGGDTVTCGMYGGCGMYEIKFINTSSSFSLDRTKTCDGYNTYREGTNLTCNITLDARTNVTCELYNSLGEMKDNLTLNGVD